MSEIINAVLTSIVLIPGFLCIYLPYKLLAIKIRFSDLELTLFSLLISMVIFSITLLTYQIVYFASLTSKILLNPIEISEITFIQLMENPVFIILFICISILFFGIGLFFISKDRLRGFRKRISGDDTVLSPGEFVWAISLRKHKKKGGYGVIETNDNRQFRGHIKRWTRDSDKNELLLNHPDIFEKDKYVPVEGIDSILFLNNDIKRIYLIS